MLLLNITMTLPYWSSQSVTDTFPATLSQQRSTALLHHCRQYYYSFKWFSLNLLIQPYSLLHRSLLQSLIVFVHVLQNANIHDSLRMFPNCTLACVSVLFLLKSIGFEVQLYVYLLLFVRNVCKRRVASSVTVGVSSIRSVDFNEEVVFLR